MPRVKLCLSSVRGRAELAERLNVDVRALSQMLHRNRDGNANTSTPQSPRTTPNITLRIRSAKCSAFTAGAAEQAQQEGGFGDHNNNNNINNNNNNDASPNDFGSNGRWSLSATPPQTKIQQSLLIRRS